MTPDDSDTVASGYVDRSRDPDLATTIATAVTDTEAVSPESPEEQVYDRIDPEHLGKALFHDRAGAPRDRMAAFRYRGYRVRVRGDGHVRVVDPAES